MQSPEPEGPFSTLGDIPETTWYHYSGGINALDPVAVSEANISDNLSGDNMPFLTVGSYYGIGMSTFEPTIGITSMDNIYMSSWGNGPSGSTAVIQCTGLIEMISLLITPVRTSTTLFSRCLTVTILTSTWISGLIG